MSQIKHGGGWRARLYEEFRGYWLNVLYLALVFGSFLQYRRFVLASHDIEYENYLGALVKAMVLAKVIMLGDVLRLARLGRSGSADRRALVWPTLIHSAVFSVFLILFTVLENGVAGWWKGRGFAGGIQTLLSKGRNELLAGTLMLVVSLIPFFAFREIGRVMGRGRLIRAFFVQSPEPPRE